MCVCIESARNLESIRESYENTVNELNQELSAVKETYEQLCVEKQVLGMFMTEYRMKNAYNFTFIEKAASLEAEQQSPLKVCFDFFTASNRKIILVLIRWRQVVATRAQKNFVI